MDTSPLVMEEVDAGAAFLERLHAYRPVKAACWLRVPGADHARGSG